MDTLIDELSGPAGTDSVVFADEASVSISRDSADFGAALLPGALNIIFKILFFSLKF